MAIDHLKNDWFFNGSVDFEQKKYVLLAYLQYIDRHFSQLMLYPSLADLIFHQKNLQRFLEQKDQISSVFPKRLESVDLKKLRLAYKQVLSDNNLLENIEKIARYALPRLKENLVNGTELYDFIEDQLEIEEVGIVPIYKREGYIIISNGTLGNRDVFAYEVNIVQSAGDSLHGIHLNYLTSYMRNLLNTLQNIKHDLIQTFRELPNPATFSIHSELKVPLDETLLPISKRLLLKRLAQ